MRRLLLIEGRHTELLMHERLMLTAAGPVPIMCVVAEGWLIQVSELGHDSVDAAKETLIFLYNIELVSAATHTSDGFAEVLREDLEGAISLLSTDEYLTDYMNQSSGELWF